MTNKSRSNTRDQVWNDKVVYDVLTKLRLEAEVDGKASSTNLKSRWIKARDSYKKSANEMAKSMILSESIVPLVGEWHAVRYQEECGNLSVMIYPTNYVDSQEEFERDVRFKEPFSKKELYNLSNGALKREDLKSLDKYADVIKLIANDHTLGEEDGIMDRMPSGWRRQLKKKGSDQGKKKAREVISKERGESVLEDSKAVDSVEVPEAVPEADKGKSGCDNISVSYHAVGRYVERVRGIKGKNNISKEISRDKQAIVDDIIEGVEQAKLIWEDEDMFCKYNEDRAIMYIISPEGSVKTLYEKDYGFSRQVNSKIVLEQAKVLREVKTKLDKSKSESEDKKEHLKLQKEMAEADIMKIELMLNKERAKRDSISQELVLVQEEEKVVLNEYAREYNRLFKKWN